MRARLIDVIAVVVLSLASGCAPGPTTADKSATPTLAHDTRHYSTIAAGFVHTCALDQQGTAFCWGNNDYSQLGAETAETCGGRPCSTSPMRVRGDTRFTVLSAGWVHNCGIAADGRAWCWGGGSVEREGYLGDGTLRRSVQPVAVISERIAREFWGDHDQGAADNARDRILGFVRGQRQDDLLALNEHVLPVLLGKIRPEARRLVDIHRDRLAAEGGYPVGMGCGSFVHDIACQWQRG